MDQASKKKSFDATAVKKTDDENEGRVVRADYWAAVIAFWLIGLVIGVIIQQLVPGQINALPATTISLVLLALLVGLSSTLFFGQAGPLSAGLAGVLSAGWMNVNAIMVLVSIIPIALTSASGSILGRKMREDSKGMDNWRDYSRDIVLYFGIGLIMAIIAGFLVSALPAIPFSIEQIGIKGLG